MVYLQTTALLIFIISFLFFRERPIGVKYQLGFKRNCSAVMESQQSYLCILLVHHHQPGIQIFLYGGWWEHQRTLREMGEKIQTVTSKAYRREI